MASVNASLAASDWLAIQLTLQLAGLTTVLLLLLALPLSYWLSQQRGRWPAVIETLVTLPLVLPPTVLGYYLLVAFSPERGLGLWLKQQFDVQLAFSFTGILLASLLYSLPFMVRPLQSAFAQLPSSLGQAAALLGFAPWQYVLRIVLPSIKPALLTAITLTFAHTVGEFGVILMIGGNIPGETQVLSVALYNHVESMEFAAANQLALLMLAFAFAVVLACQWWQRTAQARLSNAKPRGTAQDTASLKVWP